MTVIEWVFVGAAIVFLLTDVSADCMLLYGKTKSVKWRWAARIIFLFISIALGVTVVYGFKNHAQLLVLILVIMWLMQLKVFRYLLNRAAEKKTAPEETVVDTKKWLVSRAKSEGLLISALSLCYIGWFTDLPREYSIPFILACLVQISYILWQWRRKPGDEGVENKT